MKIIITESQYNLLIENNFEKNRRLISNMWDEGYTIDDMSDLIGIGKSEVVTYLKDKNIVIDCEFAEKLTSLLFWSTDLINKKYSFNDGKSTLEFTWGGFSGIIYFTYENKEVVLLGMASPYWNGVCHIPVDLQSFEDKLNGETDETLFTDMDLDNVPSQFNSIQELIDFLNNDYPKEIIKKIPDFIGLYV